MSPCGKLLSRSRSLFCALVDPGADQADFFFGEGFTLVFGRHVFVFVEDARDAVDEVAFFAFADAQDVAVFTAFFGRGQAVEAEFGFLFFGAVAFEAGFFEDRFDIGVVGEAGFAGGRRKFRDVRIGGLDGNGRGKGEPQ